MNRNKTEEIREFWNENPCGSNFISYEQDKAFYEEYDEFRYRTEGHILDELDQIDFKNKKVLEIGLGQGADSMQISLRGADYYGIDLTDESVRRLKERFKLFDLNYNSIIKDNAEKIPFEDNFFDIVYSHGVIHHSPKIDKIVSEIHRVLKPDGKAVIMLYHKNSFNYWVSIFFLRRIGLLLINAFPFLIKIVSKLTGEPVQRIEKHLKNLKKNKLEYLKMGSFINKSTDGPDNIYSSVWNKNSCKKLFYAFKTINFKIHFFNKRHLLGFDKVLPEKLIDFLGKRFGWHLWVFLKK